MRGADVGRPCPAQRCRETNGQGRNDAVERGATDGAGARDEGARGRAGRKRERGSVP